MRNDGCLVASIEHIRDGPGAGGPTSERYSYAEITETIRLSKALSGSGNGSPGIGFSGDDLLTVRLSVSRTGSAVAERPNQFASTSRIRWRVSLNKLESEGPTGATWTLARTYGDTLIETKNTVNPDIRFGANWMELDIPESLIPFTGLDSDRLFLRAEVEAVVSQGSTWIDSASAAGSMDLHFGVERGFNWTTSNGLLLSQGIYLPPELVPEPGALLGGLAAALTLAGLGRRRRAHGPSGRARGR